MSAAAQPYVPESPAQCHIDVAALVAATSEAKSARPMPYPEQDAMELQLLAAARLCADGGVQLPRRELVAVALREAARQEWWRDQAEAEAAALRRELVAAGQAHALQLQELRTQRVSLLGLLFEMVAWAATQLRCAATGDAVITAIRAKGSGFLRHDVDGALMDRVRAEVSRD